MTKEWIKGVTATAMAALMVLGHSTPALAGLARIVPGSGWPAISMYDWDSFDTSDNGPVGAYGEFLRTLSQNANATCGMHRVQYEMEGGKLNLKLGMQTYTYDGTRNTFVDYNAWDDSDFKTEERDIEQVVCNEVCGGGDDQNPGTRPLSASYDASSVEQSHFLSCNQPDRRSMHNLRWRLKFFLYEQDRDGEYMQEVDGEEVMIQRGQVRALLTNFARRDMSVRQIEKLVNVVAKKDPMKEDWSNWWASMFSEIIQMSFLHMRYLTPAETDRIAEFAVESDDDVIQSEKLDAAVCVLSAVVGANRGDATGGLGSAAQAFYQSMNPDNDPTDGPAIERYGPGAQCFRNNPL